MEHEESDSLMNLWNHVLEYAALEYGVAPDHPFKQYPDYEVLRHKDSDKWFGLLMLVKGEKLDVSNADKADEYLPILDVKCEPLLVEHLVERPGYLRAYHMNKKQWISVFLDGTVSFNEVKQALDQSYELTK